VPRTRSRPLQSYDRYDIFSYEGRGGPHARTCPGTLLRCRKTFEEAKLVGQKVKCQLKKEGKTPETHRHGVSPVLGTTICGMPNFGEGESGRSFSLRRDNKTRSSVPCAGVCGHRQRCKAEITMPGQQCNSGSNNKHLGIYDTALQAAQVRQKVKTVLEQRGDLAPAGVSPEHGVDIRGLRDFAPESLLTPTDRNGPKTKNYSKHKYVCVTRGGGCTSANENGGQVAYYGVLPDRTRGRTSGEENTVSDEK